MVTVIRGSVFWSLGFRPIVWALGLAGPALAGGLISPLIGALAAAMSLVFLVARSSRVRVEVSDERVVVVNLFTRTVLSPPILEKAPRPLRSGINGLEVLRIGSAQYPDGIPVIAAMARRNDELIRAALRRHRLVGRQRHLRG